MPARRETRMLRPLLALAAASVLLAGCAGGDATAECAAAPEDAWDLPLANWATVSRSSVVSLSVDATSVDSEGLLVGEDDVDCSMPDGVP